MFSGVAPSADEDKLTGATAISQIML